MASWGFILIAVLAAASMLIVFNWRRPVNLTRVIFINKPVDDVWQQVDYLNSDLSWQQHLERVELDEDGQTIHLFHVMKRDDGSRVEWHLQFEVVGYEPGKKIMLRRTGIDGLVQDDRLLELEIELKPQESGTLVSFHEKWGGRSLTGLALAHMDAASALARLKSWVETGNANPKGKSAWTTAIISCASLLATAAAFSLLLGWEMGVIFVGLLVLHEFGHLVSFRLIGQPWGKIVFMPFLGGVAVSRIPHLRLADDAFCAIMGAGLSIVALAPAFIVHTWEISSPEVVRVAYVIAALAGALNLLNLLPVFPLDGGRVLRAVMQSLMPNHVRLAMFVIAGLVSMAGVYFYQPILVAIAVVAFFQSARLGPANGKIALMTPYAACVMCGAYISLAAVHGVALATFWPSIV